MRSVRIGNGCGFWGDNIDAPARLAREGKLDYLTLEYLAELTMSILGLLKKRDPNAGYATDFIEVLNSLAPILTAQPGLKIVTNAGGMNPHACAKKALETLTPHGLTPKIAVVSGDDLMPRLDELIEAGHLLPHFDTGEPITRIRDKVVSANAYMGSSGVASALGLGARIVITGRVADAVLAVGPLMHEFGWKINDWDKLAAGTTAGHLIECGAQATGGLWCSADASTRLADVGYPIAEIMENGDFTISKPQGTGGAVNIETIAEQLLYEVIDPAKYYTPDVIADFTSPKIVRAATDVVSVTGTKGLPASDSYKVSAAYRDGYTASGTLVILGPNATDKARLSGQILLERLRRAGFEFQESYVEVLGGGDCVPGVLPTSNPPEVVLRVAVRDPRKAALERFSKEFAPLVTAGLPGTTGYTTGRPSIREVYAYWPALIKKSVLEQKVEFIT